MCGPDGEVLTDTDLEGSERDGPFVQEQQCCVFFVERIVQCAFL